jgi:hypothetical protein
VVAVLKEGGAAVYALTACVALTSFRGAEVQVLIAAIGSGRLTRWGIGALVLLLAHGLVAPRSAWAGCNHLVTSQADRQLGVHQLDELLTGGAPGLIAEGAGRERPVPRPCSGPGCSSSIPRPASTATPSSVGPDQWVALASVLRWIVASPPRLVPDEPAARPAAHQPSIFHPPPA